MIDHTHEAARRSWVASANGHAEFPLQNLPLGVFSPPGGAPRAGVAIGDRILDVAAALEAGLFSSEGEAAARAAAGETLNGFMALPVEARRAFRRAVFAILAEGGPGEARAEDILHAAAGCAMHRPARIGDYTDFYAGIHHARNVGTLFRPDNPLLPNYKHVPIGYHGRASTVMVSGAPVRRPNGQRKRPEDAAPDFGPCRNLDYELELGLWMGPGSALGETIPIAEAGSRIVGVSLLNDWSARDLQAWEYQPLGPFLAKNFVSTVSPWIVTAEALAPFRLAQAPRPEGDPRPLDYLWDDKDQAEGALDIELEVQILTPAMKAAGTAPARLALSSARHMYWTPAQLLAHHASNGCAMAPGDLLGTGTISAPDPSGLGSLLELTRGGREPFALPGGETRGFLQDGDEVRILGRCRREGFAPIGFGPCVGTVLPA